MLETLMTAAFAAGLLGGVHCAAMCGGIVAAACGPRRGGTRRGQALAYNLGRVASYVIAGAAAGAVGASALWLRGGAAAQQFALTLAGASLVLLALYMAGVPPLVRAVEAAGTVLWRRIEPLSRWFLPADTLPRALGLGLVWGWLPCGMVYAALLTAAASGNALDGALVMAAFGAGTLPNLLAISAAAGRFAQWGRRRAARLAAAAVIGGVGVFGVLHAATPSAVTTSAPTCSASGGAAAPAAQ